MVRSLLQNIADLQAQVQRLEDEIRRLKGGPPRPQLKPNTLQAAVAATQTPSEEAVLQRGHPQRAKTAELVIHETCRIELDGVPAGAQFQDYRSFVVQDVVIQVHNVHHERAQRRLPIDQLLKRGRRKNEICITL